MTRLVLVSVVLGVGLGYLLQGRVDLAFLDLVASAALVVLLVAIGIELGHSRQVIMQPGWLDIRLLLVPLACAVGSVAGSALVGVLIGIGPGLGGAVGAGFGWYSLSAVLLTQLHGADIGTVAFLANAMREFTAFLVAPALAGWLGGHAAIAAAGATAMDSALPLITRVAGRQAAPLAFLTGVILSALVPVLVPFLASL